MPPDSYGLRSLHSLALDPARTLEERFATELVVEMGVTWWHADRKNYSHESFEVQQERVRQRALNLAYQPHYTEDAVRKAAEQLHKFTCGWSTAPGTTARSATLPCSAFCRSLKRWTPAAVLIWMFLGDLPKLRELSLECR